MIMNSEVLHMVDVGSQIFVAVSSPLIVGFIYKVSKMIQKDRNAHAKLEGGLRSMLRSQILQMYEAGKEKGGMTLMQKSTVEELYTDYKSLGGNGFVEDIIQKVHNMKEIEE